MDRPVPVACVLIKADAVPPVAVEATVRKLRDLGKDIEKTLPNDVPGKELLKEHGKQHVADNPRKLFPSFIKCHACLFLSGGFNDNWIDVGLTDDDHHPDDTQRGRCLLGHIPPVNLLLTRVLEIVDQGRQARPFDKIVQGQVVRVYVGGRRAFSTELFIKYCDFRREDTLEGLYLFAVQRLICLNSLANGRNLRLFRREVRRIFWATAFSMSQCVAI